MQRKAPFPLDDSTSQLGNISTLASLVSDLASHRNILALNAAVKAVRAGKYDKGLALVAREIRKLADESQEAAQKINGTIPEIKRAIYSTVKATEEGAKTAAISIPVAFIPDVNSQQPTVNSQQSTVNSQQSTVNSQQSTPEFTIPMKRGFDITGVKTARDMAEAFTGLREACNLVFTSNQQIYFNIKQQAIAIQQVGDAMNSLNQAAFQTVSGITQAKIGTQKPNEAALNFKSVMSEVCSEGVYGI
ncbi:hypothetical protein IQ269_23880 [Tychonema sp. LEGE 07199]|uniref:methyl-accepting chemotaxis protein n=1 Tax=unclassified Tychonema TaxID=2642144 RepID=UPI0018825694|nr:MULTISPECIES: methyl-accepting chemotaxis protein [unclassified Tychonema]MBE9123753.1 hypothetical protein [Tychonema sp. LEGE 07199]MBE9134841.1 hypothetical protein [Tychonema sp. LEGE 07196]